MDWGSDLRPQRERESVKGGDHPLNLHPTKENARKFIFFELGSGWEWDRSSAKISFYAHCPKWVWESSLYCVHGPGTPGQEISIIMSPVLVVTLGFLEAASQFSLIL